MQYVENKNFNICMLRQTTQDLVAVLLRIFAEKRCFAAVHPDRPFAHLDILNAAVYGEENEEVGLLWD